MSRTKGVVLLVSPIGLPEEAEFDANRNYSCCRICGELYQPALERVLPQEYTPQVQFASEILRRDWTRDHARKHSTQEHQNLERSGRYFTAEAAYKLIPFGVIPLSDLVLYEDAKAAGLETPRMPNNTPISTTTKTTNKFKSLRRR